MIFDPKHSQSHPAPPIACHHCAQSFEPHDSIVPDTNEGVTTYWHRACADRVVNEQVEASERRLAESTDPLVVRLRDALRRPSR